MKPSAQRVALITGGGLPLDAPGCGAACSLALASDGFLTVVIDRDPAAAHRTVERVRAIGGEAVPVIADLGEASGCRLAVAEALRLTGHVDVLVNNVALMISGTVVDLTEEDWNRSLAVTLSSVMFTSQGVLPGMIERRSGSIVNIVSSVGLRGIGTAAGYAAAKGGVVGLTREMAVAHGGDGVRVNAVMPGHIYTAMADSQQPGAGMRDLRRRIAPLKTEGRPEDVAFAVAFLVSDRARWVNGVIFPVDAGMMATIPLAVAPEFMMTAGHAQA